MVIRRHQDEAREMAAIPTRIAGDQGPSRNRRMGTDEEVGQGAHTQSTRLTVDTMALTRQERGL